MTKRLAILAVAILAVAALSQPAEAGVGGCGPRAGVGGCAPGGGSGWLLTAPEMTIDDDPSLIERAEQMLPVKTRIVLRVLFGDASSSAPAPQPTDTDTTINGVGGCGPRAGVGGCKL